MRTGFAPGKIILSGEYAVVFGYPGIAVPLKIGVTAEFEENPSLGRVALIEKSAYIEKAVALCIAENPALSGRLSVRSDIPIGKGLGSSSATVIAIVRALLGDDSRTVAQKFEETLTPGVSGIDFTTCWENAPTIFKKGSAPENFRLSENLLQDAALIDTGTPDETTAELVASVRARENELSGFLKQIGNCTERLIQGEALPDVMREHHKAQVALGVVPIKVQELICRIESTGGSAKVVGAGGSSDGAGLVLAIGNTGEIRDIADGFNMPILSL